MQYLVWLKLQQRPLFISLCLIAPLLAALELGDDLLTYAEKNFGAAAKIRLLEWQKLANTPKEEDELKTLEKVNRFFNQAKFVSDIKHWGKKDYWATPVEMLITNAGDCEDYSIGKYFTLREMGISDEKLRITYVKALELNQAHMVLAYYPTPQSDPLVLDNLKKEIKPASARKDLAPVYSFNGEGLWLSRLRGQGKRIGNAQKLERWVEVNKRLLSEVIKTENSKI